MASKWLWCIFQLPLISGFLAGLALTVSRPRSIGSVASSGVHRAAERGQAGQVALLDELEAGAATGRDVVDVVVVAELLQRGGAVATAHDGERLGVGHGLGHGPGARREPVVLEQAHRAVPEDR